MCTLKFNTFGCTHLYVLNRDAGSEQLLLDVGDGFHGVGIWTDCETVEITKCAVRTVGSL